MSRPVMTLGLIPGRKNPRICIDNGEGVYRVIATSFAGAIGNFNLKIREN